MSRGEFVLAFLLRAIAVAASLAVVPVFMPHAWIEHCRGWLGLGTALPETPIMVYLTRSLSVVTRFQPGTLPRR